MSDLEPNTRAENFWVNEGDLEPITRKEQYIKHLYDETQVVPEYPKTREEYFINKAGEELHDVTIEQLNVTENGTYSEAGKAYSPVIVEVPEPTLISKSISENGTYTASSDNADGYSSVDVNVEGYKISEVSGLPSPIASFSDGANLPMPKLEVSIEPVQSGSGDPSPTNIRPISGWSAVDVTIQDDIDNPTTTETITIQLGSTYYGGTLDVVSGVMTLTHGYVDLGTVNWSYISSDGRSLFTSNDITDYKHTGSNNIPVNAICECFAIVAMDATFVNGQMGMDGDNARNRTIICDNRYSNASDFKTAMNGVQLVYELATPITIQLTPTAVKSLPGTNNLSANTGDVVEASYWEEL